MSEPDKQAIRRKATGVLLRHVRARAGRSQAEVAAALHVSRRRYGQYEQGHTDISLPELELVASLCGMPLGYFFDETAAVEDEGSEVACQVASRLQRKIVGTLLRQARQCAGKPAKDCAAALGVSTRMIGQYEKGERGIPPSELEVLACLLEVPLGYFAVDRVDA